MTKDNRPYKDKSENELLEERLITGVKFRGIRHLARTGQFFGVLGGALAYAAISSAFPVAGVVVAVLATTSFAGGTVARVFANKEKKKLKAIKQEYKARNKEKKAALKKQKKAQKLRNKLKNTNDPQINQDLDYERGLNKTFETELQSMFGISAQKGNTPVNKKHTPPKQNGPKSSAA